MSKEQKISVNFCTYQQYDDFPCTNINLGQIDTIQLNKLLAEFEKNTSRPHTCIQTIHIEFCDMLSFGKMPGGNKRYRSLDLSNMFYFYDARNPETHAPCMAGKKQPQTEDAMTRTCANNLRCGKCCDEFIRRTLGATLFPQKYSNQKQN